MNAATRGVILAIAAVIIGVIVLGQGFDDAPTLTTSPAPATDDGGAVASDDGNGDDSAASDDSGATADDGGNGDDSAASDDSGATADDGGGDDDSGIAADDSAATDGTGDDGTDTPSILHPPQEVRVLVANGTTVAGAAGATANQLQNDRAYNSLTPTNTSAGVNVESSLIYYAPGYELDARQIAQILNAAPGAVAPMPADPPVAELQEAHVLVVLGPDLVSG